MKYLLILFVVSIVGCYIPDPSRIPNKYKIYDVVYLQPDTIKAIITDTMYADYPNKDVRYRVVIKSENGINAFNITEGMIISKVDGKNH